MAIAHTLRASIFFPILFALSFAACTKDELNTDASFKLEFSTDTVVFDTVFTSVGSITKSLVIRNTSNKPINVSKISLARGKASPFRLNIDGTSAEDYQDLEIGANDSAYIFVKVTIDPKNENNPFIESDSVVFQTNGNIQDVKLIAWGQDAYFHLNTLLSGEITLPSDKPHVVYGKLIATDGCKLIITEGTKIYFHTNSSLEINSGASLQVSGTLDFPVIFTGDRLDGDYPETPGMWDGIWLKKGSMNNRFTHAEITNAKTGILADSCGSGGGDPLKLHNCLIHNMSNFGIRATWAQIRATNCQITNCGGNVVSIEKGGNYDFRNCTLARYFGGSGYPALSISNYVMDTSGKVKLPGELTGAYFGNCIITGNFSDEVDFNELIGVAFIFQFDQCLVNWNKQTTYESHFTNCFFDEDVKFIDPYINKFQLDTLSFAIDKASLSIINSTEPDIRSDRKGVSRLIPGPPDLGAYERVEKL